MKKSLWIAAALLGALAAAGCQSEKMEPEQPSGPKTLKVIAESEDTRTGIYLDTDKKYKAYWTEDDEITLFEAIEANVSTSASQSDYLRRYWSVNTTLGDEKGRTAIFEFELDDRQESLPENGVFSYLAYHPAYSANVGWAGVDLSKELWEELMGVSLTSNHMVVVGSIPSNQKPSSDSFDPNSDVLVSRLFESATQPEELRFSFARIGSIAKITLKGLPAGYYVTSGTFSYGSSWQGVGEFLYDTQLERELPVLEAMGYQSSYSPITFTPQNVQVNAAGDAVIWLRTLSGKLTDRFSIDVSVSPDGVSPSYMKFSKEVDLEGLGKSITFREGSISSFSVKLEGQSLIEFDEETTLKCFPELTGGGQAVIKIPKDYRPSYYYNSGWDWEDGYPFFFESEFSWDVSIEFPYGYTNDEKWISVSQQDEGYYLKVDSKTALPETATLVLTCTSDSDIAPIEIPIEGFNLVTLRKDGYYLDPDDWTRYIFMTSGETSVFTAEIRLPSWLEMVPDSFCWTVLEDGDEDESVSYEVGQDNSLTVTAGDRGFSVDGSIKFLDQILEDGEEYEHSGYVCIDVMPRHIPLKWNNVDWNMKVLMLTYDETVTIQADLSGISTEDIDTFEWSWDHDAYGSGYMDFIIPTDDPHSVDVSAGSWSDGATLDLSVTMKDGTVYYSSCYIVVSPIIIELKKNGMRLYGDPIVLSPGEHCELKASLNLESISEDYTAKWRVETNKYISVYSYGFSPYETTVTAEAPGDDYAIFEIWEQWGYYSHQTDLRYSLEYPVHVLLEDQ